uniref:MBL associated serine protease 1 n=1 Tax=Erpetoichthys calabaricus TaxID=27687 RepID=A0A8C4RZ30_ERPCA
MILCLYIFVLNRYLHILALCLLVPQFNAVELSGMYGSIQSPNFPDSYPRDSDISWNISVPDGFKIKLYFMHFDLEPSYLCEYDYVKVRGKKQELLARFCGREDTDTEQVPGEQAIVSPKSSLAITFKSDFSNEERFTGFEAHFTAIDVDECKERNDEELACDHYCHNYIGGYYCSCRFGYLLHSDNRTCDDLSSGHFDVYECFNSQKLDVKLSMKPVVCLHRLTDAECHFHTTSPANTNVIETNHETQTDYDSSNLSCEKTEFGPFCGDQSPGKIETGSNRVQILFHSDNSGDNGGWKLTYSAVGTPCPVPKPPENGKIVPALNKYSFKDQVLITCDPGFKILKVTITNALVCLFGDSLSQYAFHFVLLMKPTYSSKSIESSPKIFSFSVDTDKLDPHLCLCLCLLPVCGQPARQLPGLLKRIVGGRTAEPGFFPWQALIMVEDVSRVPEGKWFGSGALLSDSWVLTAAHVLRSPRRDNTVIPVSEEHVTIYLGLHDVRNKTDAINRTAEKIVLHERFDPKNYNNDIALVKLKNKVKMSQFIMPVCLPTTDQSEAEPQPHALGLVAGWGLSNPNYVKLPVVMHTECKTSYESRSGSYNITNNMFCAGYYEGGKDTCLGDSGGAFVMEDPQTKRWVAQGLVSWGGPEECGSQRVYGVYTKVSNYIRWLEDKLHKH